MSLHLHCGSEPHPHRLGAHELASADDRAWFEINRDRHHRIRRAFMGEGQLHPDKLSFIAVRQVAPGARVRIGMHVPSPAPESEACELEAEVIFQRLMDADPGIASMVEAMQRATEGRA